MTAPSIKEALELKPCPFCGGEPAFNKVTYSERMVKDQEWGQDTFHGVNCVMCGASNLGLVGHKDQERAAASWNTRATLSPPAGERREALATAFAKRFPGVLSDYSQYKIVDWFIASGLVQDEAANGNRALPYDRDQLGRFVREAWVRWAETQPNPKPSWLLPYDDLGEPDKEADRQIGEAVARWALIGDAAIRSARDGGAES